MAGQPQLPLDSSLYANANNDTSTQQTFDERQKYDFISYERLGAQSYFDFWGRDKYYSRIDPSGDALVVNESRLGQLRYATSALFSLDFVAHAWRDYAEKMRTLSSAGKIYRVSPYAQPEAYRAWSSLPVAYEEYLGKTIFPAFMSYVTPAIERKIRTFASFLAVFADFSQEVIGSTGPITLSGFVESIYCSPQNTGLVIEMAEEDHSADYQKVKKYLMDKNYNIASNIASQYGFVLDKNAPWRLVANVSSPAMQEYMFGVFLTSDFRDSRNDLSDCGDVIETPAPNPIEPFGYSNLPGFTGILRHAPGFDAYREMFEAGPGFQVSPSVAYQTLCDGAYEKAWVDDMDALKVNLWRFYNTYTEKVPVTSLPANHREGCEPTILRRTPVSVDIVSPDHGLYRDKWNLRAYYNFRALEKGITPPPTTAAMDIRDIMNLYNYSTGDADFKYLRALRRVQDLVGRTGTLSATRFNYFTVGDMIY